MKYCAKCWRRGTNDKGRWNLTHFTDEHGKNRTAQTQEASQTQNAPSSANVVQGTAPTDTASPTISTRTFLVNQLIDAMDAAKLE